MSIFEEGSPFQGFLNKVTDLLILNLVTLLLCLPVITAGAALTAMHYVLLKMVRGEEGYIVKSFFRAFKREFRQATVMWVAGRRKLSAVASQFHPRGGCPRTHMYDLRLRDAVEVRQQRHSHDH